MSEYRKKLEQLTEERRYSFRGVLTYTGYKDSSKYRYTKSYYVPTFMLQNVEYWDEENNAWEFVADHLWMNYTKQFKYYYPLLKDDIKDKNNIFHKKPKKDGSVMVSHNELKNAASMISIEEFY